MLFYKKSFSFLSGGCICALFRRKIGRIRSWKELYSGIEEKWINKCPSTSVLPSASSAVWELLVTWFKLAKFLALFWLLFSTTWWKFAEADAFESRNSNLYFSKAVHELAPSANQSFLSCGIIIPYQQTSFLLFRRPHYDCLFFPIRAVIWF